VDNFDDFAGGDSGGTGLLPDGSPTCGVVACGHGAAALLTRVASANQLQQQRDDQKRDDARAAGLAKAMPPSSPGQIPGRAFSMPGGGGGSGGAAFVLLSLFAVLMAALSRVDWTTSFQLPTATWRLSGYVPPIESPG
jgi:hypothetical protein